VVEKVFLMICLICRQAELVDGFTSIPFEREEFRLLINHVPAHICPGCGEAIVDEDVAIHLLSMAEEIINEGIIEDIRDYGV
jgi:YgiT-type zinc finger domain-containing protein